MNILITLCARGGSKGVPGKNIKPLNGKPLISYSIEAAQGFATTHRADIALSTDDEGIKTVAEQFGIHSTYTRPSHLASDTAGKVETIADLLFFEEARTGKRYDYVLDLDVSAPLRTVDDLLQSFQLMEQNQDAWNLFSVSPPHKNPYFNMVELASDGYYKLVKKMEGVLLTRQSAPKVYDLNASFYFYRRNFFEQGFKSVLTDKALAYELPHVSFDIDEPLDFDIMEFLVSNNKLGFTL
jgi:CMP-N,N'-diacetyllegionaminic acid synthase